MRDHTPRTNALHTVLHHKFLMAQVTDNSNNSDDVAIGMDGGSKHSNCDMFKFNCANFSAYLTSFWCVFIIIKITPITILNHLSHSSFSNSCYRIGNIGPLIGTIFRASTGQLTMFQLLLVRELLSFFVHVFFERPLTNAPNSSPFPLFLPTHPPHTPLSNQQRVISAMFGPLLAVFHDGEVIQPCLEKCCSRAKCGRRAPHLTYSTVICSFILFISWLTPKYADQATRVQIDSTARLTDTNMTNAMYRVKDFDGIWKSDDWKLFPGVSEYLSETYGMPCNQMLQIKTYNGEFHSFNDSTPVVGVANYGNDICASLVSTSSVC